MFDHYNGSVDHPDAGELGWLAFQGILVGAVSGGCAVIFRYMIAFFHNLAFRGEWSFTYNSLKHTAPSPWGVGIILVPLIGAIVVAFLVKNFAPRARSHGVPEVMDSIYYREGKILPVLALIKGLSSAISIGTGGSIGREGPIVQITSTVGSMLGSWLNLPGRVRTVLLAAAAAGGVAGSFDTPLGGVLFTVELFLPAVSAAALLPVTLSAVVATIIARVFIVNHPELPIGNVAFLNNEIQLGSLPALLLLGLAVGIVSTLFIQALCRSENWFNALAENYYVRHTFGMLLVGLEIYGFLLLTGHYYVEGIGYATIFELLRGGISAPLLLGLLFLGKFVATCVTLGSGGSGGVFCPSLFLGALTGAAFGEFLNAFMPELGVPRELLILAGMAAAVGATTGAVLTGIVMTAEMTGHYDFLIGAAIASVVAFALRRAWIGGGIYTQKLIRRGRSIPEGLQSAVWTSRRAVDLMAPLPPGELPSNMIRVDFEADLDAVLREWNDLGADGVIVTRDNAPVGIIRDLELGNSCRAMAERMV